jgi:hypothetical protein
MGPRPSVLVQGSSFFVLMFQSLMPSQPEIHYIGYGVAWDTGLLTTTGKNCAILRHSYTVNGASVPPESYSESVLG